MSDNNDGVWFQSACSGLWYQNPQAAGDIVLVRIDGVNYYREKVTAERHQPLIDLIGDLRSALLDIHLGFSESEEQRVFELIKRVESEMERDE